LAFLGQPSNTVTGVLISPAVTVQVFDQFGNLVTTDGSNVTVALRGNPSGGTLSDTLTVAAVGGVAPFSNLSVDRVGVGYPLTSSHDGLRGATSNAFYPSTTLSRSLAFLGQPSNTVAGVLISPAVTVQVLDRFGNLVTTDKSNVTVALGSNPG